MNANADEDFKIEEDDFWSTHIPFFTAQFPTSNTKPQKVWGRFHISEEKYVASSHEIIPIKEKKGNRTYVMMQPYVLEADLTITVGLYNKPKVYADQDCVIGETIATPEKQGFRELQIGNAQAWYYHTDKIIVLWECFLDHRYRKLPLSNDINMQNLWNGFEHWLLKQFPQAHTIATPFNDPIANSIEEYQSFLSSVGYSPLAAAAYGKTVKGTRT
jgi:hypothetical protein